MVEGFIIAVLNIIIVSLKEKRQNTYLQYITACIRCATLGKQLFEIEDI